MKQTETAHAAQQQSQNSTNKETESKGTSSIKTPQADILANLTGNENPTTDNTILVNRIQWEESPLTICSIDEETKWFLALGTKRLTEYYPTQRAIELLLEAKSWELMIQIMIAVTEDTQKYLALQAIDEHMKEMQKNELQKHNQSLTNKNGL